MSSKKKSSKKKKVDEEIVETPKPVKPKDPPKVETLDEKHMKSVKAAQYNKGSIYGKG